MASPKENGNNTTTLIETRLLAETRASGGSSPGSEEAFESDGRRVLGVLARLAASVPPEVAQPLAHKLLEMLLDLVARPETSAALVAALHMLCFAQVCPRALMSSCPRWWTLFFVVAGVRDQNVASCRSVLALHIVWVRRAASGDRRRKRKGSVERLVSQV